MRIVFLGTPSFSVDILSQLIKTHHEIIAVVSQPDKPVGRKQILIPTPTKQFAIENNIPVYQFQKIRKDGVETLRALNPDIMVTAAYGQIISKEILDIPKFGIINVHGSLLPKYRGSSPLQWCLINGEKETGVTIMKTDVGIDNGDMIQSQSFLIEEDDTLETLFKKASLVGGKLLIDTLDKIENGTVEYHKQNEDEMSYYPMLKKEMGYIDLNDSAEKLKNLIRGISNWPTATVQFNDKKINIYKVHIENLDGDLNNYKNGEVVLASGKKGIIVKVADGFLSLDILQAEGSKMMDGKSFANGNKLKVGDILTKVEI